MNRRAITPVRSGIATATACLRIVAATRRCRLLLAVLAGTLVTACTRTAIDPPVAHRGDTGDATTAATTPAMPTRRDTASAQRDGIHLDATATTGAASNDAASRLDGEAFAGARTSVDGPHTIELAPGRPIYYARSVGAAEPARLIAHLHGQCGHASYACGSWLHAGAAAGVLVCPTGNARCGDSGVGPPSWDGATWKELTAMMDADLETSIAKVEAKHPRALRREGAVLTGYSRGGYAVPILAARHPKRWPYLVVIEADATLTADGLRRAGVVAVALVAGELGDQVPGMRKSADDLVAAGFPARLFVMPKTGHLYSANMEEIMQNALAFVLAHELQ